MVADFLLMASEMPINVEVHHQDDSGVASSASSSNSSTNENSASTNSANLDSNPKTSAWWNVTSKKRLKALEEKSKACNRARAKASAEKLTWGKPISRRTLEAQEADAQRDAQEDTTQSLEESLTKVRRLGKEIVDRQNGKDDLRK